MEVFATSDNEWITMIFDEEGKNTPWGVRRNDLFFSSCPCHIETAVLRGYFQLSLCVIGDCQGGDHSLRSKRIMWCSCVIQDKFFNPLNCLSEVTYFNECIFIEFSSNPFLGESISSLLWGFLAPSQRNLRAPF